MPDDSSTARTNPGEPVLVEDGAAVQGSETTSLACYLQKGNDVTWQWGLNNDNSWYKLNGSWYTTPYTKLQKFVTNTSESEIIAAAHNAIRYYERRGYEVLAVFAADKSAGYSYPIVAGGRELYPKY